MTETIGLGFIIAGIFFNFTGTLSLVRFPDVLSRLAAALKCVSFGTSLILFGAFLTSPGSQEGLKAILCIVFLLFTAPVSAASIGRAAYLYELKKGERGK
jgi:multicomponent Na+:H+ antiporter subunit G